MRGNGYFACRRALRVEANGSSQLYLASLVAALIALLVPSSALGELLLPVEVREVRSLAAYPRPCNTRGALQRIVLPIVGPPAYGDPPVAARVHIRVYEPMLTRRGDRIAVMLLTFEHIRFRPSERYIREKLERRGIALDHRSTRLVLVE